MSTVASRTCLRAVETHNWRNAQPGNDGEHIF